MTQQAQELLATWGNPDEVIAIEPLTAFDVEQAWDESLIATDLYEIACMRQMPRRVIEQRREEMQSAARHAQDVQNLYYEQYEQREAELAVA